MSLYERAKNIAFELKNKVGYSPEIAIILGSGLDGFSDSVKVDFAVNYSEIEGMPVPTVPGHVGRFVFGTSWGKKVVIAQGRFHLYEGYSTDDVTLPVRVFQLMGVKNLIVTNAAGAINTLFKPGDMMALTDHISLFCPTPLTGKNDDRFGKRFPSMDSAYDKKMLELADIAAHKTGIELKKGVYCYCKGPMYETPAEIRMLGRMGCDVVGMSTVPEVIAAVHGGLRVLGISCITNMAAGISQAPLSHEEVIETGILAQNRFTKLLLAVLRLM